MKPKEFPEVNTIYAKDQPEYQPLPVFKDGKGTVVSCWKLTDEEIINIAKNGYIWLSVMTFNQPLQPIFLTTEKNEVLASETVVDNEVERSRLEGVLQGLKICKEMWAQGTISSENIRENEIHYSEELKNL